MGANNERRRNRRRCVRIRARRGISRIYQRSVASVLAEPELTAQSFTVNPADPLQRSYHTGDLVRRRPDGLVEFVGRKDSQIKLHGYRIEPNEVESALKACTGVTDAAVLVRKNAVGVPVALAGYVQLQADDRRIASGQC